MTKRQEMMIFTFVFFVKRIIIIFYFYFSQIIIYSVITQTTTHFYVVTQALRLIPIESLPNLIKTLGDLIIIYDKTHNYTLSKGTIL